MSEIVISHEHFDRGVLLALIIAEAVLFHSYYSREIGPFIADYWDQTHFLAMTYQLQERVSTHGLIEFWKDMIHGGHPNGIALPIEGAFAGLLLGGSRLPQLCINFAAFCALQVCVFRTARLHFKASSYGYLALGLILSQSTLWFFAGGLFDFRIDFINYCLYGIWTCAVLRSGCFADRRWAVVAALVGGFLVLHEFFTIIYFIGVLFGFGLLCIAVNAKYKANVQLAYRARQRLYNTGLSLGLIVLMAVPFIIINWTAIHDYYVVGLVTGDEKYIRAREFGIFNFADHLGYYPRSIIRDHLGYYFLVATAAVAVLTLLLRRVLRSNRIRPEQHSLSRCGDRLLEIGFLLGAVSGPIVALTCSISKSPVVGGIVAVPLALLVVSASSQLANVSVATAGLMGRIVTYIALGIFALGLVHQFSSAAKYRVKDNDRRTLVQLTELNEWIVRYAEDHGWQAPKISVDALYDRLNAGTLTVKGFEQFKTHPRFTPMLGGGIFSVTRMDALSLMADSDFFVTTSFPKVSVYPFNQAMSEYAQDLKSWANENMIEVRRVSLGEYAATVYVRPSIKISGISGNWITSSGLSMDVTPAALERFRLIRLSGVSNLSWLPKLPLPAVTVDTQDGEKTLPATFRHTANTYEILIDTSSLVKPSTETTRFHLRFDTFFVPKALGINDDIRQLVLAAPDRAELRKVLP